MDFITGLPRSRMQPDSIWVIIDRMTKLAHFWPLKTIYQAKDYARLYFQNVVKLHGVPEIPLFFIKVHNSRNFFRQISVKK